MLMSCNSHRSLTRFNRPYPIAKQILASFSNMLTIVYSHLKVHCQGQQFCHYICKKWMLIFCIETRCFSSKEHPNRIHRELLFPWFPTFKRWITGTYDCLGNSYDVHRPLWISEYIGGSGMHVCKEICGTNSGSSSLFQNFFDCGKFSHTPIHRTCKKCFLRLLQPFPLSWLYISYSLKKCTYSTLFSVDWPTLDCRCGHKNLIYNVLDQFNTVG